ncbi:uncharacterized protein LOC131866671 [Cryptomeria japonica]|uniref:uncharacterized protein LOC131866671 n=1 Tax=Cryptomeria japonica TaxID=3369 RepID=UPI0027DAA754|nr:uncharacterized protein LOC131866671 [Cryptomeria japonica]
MEDFWANLQDSFEEREKYYHRLTIPQIRDFGIETNIPKQLHDDGILLDLVYNETEIDKRPLPPIKWSQQEVVDIDTISQAMPAPTMTPTTETITIHNVESDSDQEEVEPTPKKDEEKEIEQKQFEENDERLVLTPQDVENLLKDTSSGDKEQQSQEPTKGFNEQVSEKLEEYQQQLDTDGALRANLAQQVLQQQQQISIPVLPAQEEVQAHLDTQVEEEEKNEEESLHEAGRMTSQITTEEENTD